ncbi:hypothetical protein AAE478_006789 [Parahypoxylon ruwenzoriense]
MAPSFGNTALFPAFHELPVVGGSSPVAAADTSTSSSSSGGGDGTWFLLAQIREDMTITQPTLIVRDRAGAEFAVTFADGDHRGLGGTGTGGDAGGSSRSGSGSGVRFRKGHTLVVPRATRTQRGEGKKDVVRVPAGEGARARVIPAGLEQVFELGGLLAEVEEVEEVEEACQARGWSEMGHKSNCKVIRSIKEIWP